MLHTELVVAPLEHVDSDALADAERSGRVQLGLEPGLGQAALYVNVGAHGRRRVGLIRSREVLAHLQQGKQGFARLDQRVRGPLMIECTLVQTKAAR